jgi:predicted nucleic-acid-binding protein
VIGVDTNIVLRLFDRSDPDQSRAVESLLTDPENADGCLVNPIVLAEFAWTLSRTYRLTRQTIADHLERILEAPEFIVPFLDEASTAVRRYRNGTADFADYFFSEINRSLGCETTLTFDREAARDDNFTCDN